MTVTLQYVPSAGKTGELAANLLGNPRQKVVEGLRNFKKYAESQTARINPKQNSL